MDISYNVAVVHIARLLKYFHMNDVITEVDQ